MSKLPALPLWIDAWVAATHHLTRLQRGTYHDLLVLMWRTPGCRVPNDDVWLGVRLRMSESDVANELRPLIKEFCRNDGNWLTQGRLMREYEYVTRLREKQSVRAKQRWDKEKEISQRNATRGNAPTPTPTPTPTKKDETPKGVSSSKLPAGDFEAFWAMCPRKVGKGAARKAYAKALQQVAPGELLNAMRRYAATRRGEDEAYTVHPSTWLNQERWLDGKAPIVIVRDEIWHAEQNELKRKGLI